MLIKLAIFDIDGVLTNGKKTYGKDGSCISKTFCDKDFTAIKKLKSSEVKVCFCSGDSNVNELVAKNRNIDFYNSRHKDKASFIDKFSKHYKCSIKNMLYIGDDVFDISLLKKVGFSVCPSDAILEVQEVCNLILKSKGGENCIVELVNYLYNHNMIKNYNYESFINLDASDKF